MAVGFSAISIKSALVAGTLLALGAQSTASAEKYASIVIDLETDQVLHARHADAPRYPASLTKAMTLYMLFDAMKSGEVKLYEQLPVSRAAASQPPSSLRLRAGSTITTKDAINALITKSANDVAVVVAERLGGTEQRFATLMTAKAEAMGMESTTFKNASGLPNSQQLSTARDMSVLAERLLQDHADYYGYFANTKFSWGRANYRNHNKLIGKVSGVDGIKTGYTRASGFNLMASAKRRGRRVVAIMFGGSTARSRDQHVSDLIEAAYKSFEQGDEAPELRMRMTFSDIQPPIDPNAAAMPVLNGRIFGASAVVAEGDEGSKPE
ncbi:MAG: D-alanyl-D-alanine carboxypeptidase [Alphaproteobacteria bacterium]|nr:D-alanyl-D-alanine carboxypeptidase [Henriciella sp.]MBO6694452.1 D-alanyl-D-alanine carboxypeptidase [Henriciella sp.]MCH9752258.1 D-alanyl-D-alanine carboxypeptidase [Alphaproteobacteria bacterium]